MEEEIGSASRANLPALSHRAICSGVYPFRKTIAIEAPQPVIFVEDGFTPQRSW
jgi:hypothetical protein